MNRRKILCLSPSGFSAVSQRVSLDFKQQRHREERSLLPSDNASLIIRKLGRKRR